MIVLNGEPFIGYNLRSIYPYAHQIIVVEGACPAARDVASPDGHSRDQTMATLRRFHSEEDPDRKLVIVTAEDEGHPDGFWSEKDEMSQAYARRAAGNYLWQLDCDEFYHEADLPRIMDILSEGVDAVTFPTLTFWGGLRYTVDGFHLRCNRYREFHRLFAWDRSYTYATHRPPTVLDATGTDLRKKRWLRADDLERQRLYMYHYCMLFPKQVLEKAEYYSRVTWTDQFLGMTEWAQSCYLKLERPFRVHEVFWDISWLETFYGSHPAMLREMFAAAEAGRFPGLTVRLNDDADDLLASWSYRCQRDSLRLAIPLIRLKRRAKCSLAGIAARSRYYPQLRGIVNFLKWHNDSRGKGTR